MAPHVSFEINKFVSFEINKFEKRYLFEVQSQAMTEHAVVTGNGNAPARLACLHGIETWIKEKFEKLLERSIVRDRSIKFFPSLRWKRGKNFIGWATRQSAKPG